MAAKILIADDYADNRELLRLLLSTANYEVCEACDGAECVEMARADAPDLILIDLSMPGLDGWEVMKALQKDPRTRDLPCVAVTAHAYFDPGRALNAGFAGFLPKPFRSEDLFEIVGRLVSQRDAKSRVAATVERKTAGKA